MGKIINEIGNVYGKLTVIEEAGIDKTGHKKWRCQCECGKIIEVRGSRLRNNEKQDCGCVKKHGFIDETGNRYGRLTVLKLSNKKSGRHAYWECQCDCGNITIVRSSDLRQGKTRSCGCFMDEVRGETLIKDETGKRYGKLTVLERDYSFNHVYWKCRCDCGNLTSVQGIHLRNGSVKSCGCISSFGEQQILQLLQSHNIPYKKEKTFKDLLSQNGGFLRFDFAIFDTQGIKCLIEYQGEQHYIDKGEFGKEQRENTDRIKLEYCTKNNIPLIIVKYNENIEEKLSFLWDDCKEGE